jgi:hypothetical protein
LDGLKLALAVIARKETDRMLCGVCNHYRPAGFEKYRNIPPGALFVMVEARAGGGPSYGRVELKKRGSVELNHHGINDFSELVQRCLDGL